MKRGVVAGGALGGAGLLLAACQLLVGIEDRYPYDAGADATDAGHDARRDATRDAGVDRREADAGRDRTPGCVSAVAPARPAKSSPTGASEPFVVAIQSFWYDLNAEAGVPPGVTLGFNLDDDCTCEGKPPGPPSCVQDAARNCDADGGRDLVGNRLLQAVDTLGGSRTVAQLLNSKIAIGQVTLIVRAENYDLGEDQTEISLSSYVAGGLLRADGGAEAGLMPPAWDGHDMWTVDPRSASSESMVDGGWTYEPIFFDTNAYVTRRTLVAHLGDFQIGLGQANISLNDAVVVAKIEGDATTGGYMLIGQVAGRVPISTIFAVASTFPDPMTDGGHFCGDDTIFHEAIRPYVCRAADIMSTSAQDNRGLTCDSISIAMGFVARKIEMGPPYMGLDPTLGCDGSVGDCEGF